MEVKRKEREEGVPARHDQPILVKWVRRGARRISPLHPKSLCLSPALPSLAPHSQSHGMQPALSKAPPTHALPPTGPRAPAIPSRPPPSPSSSYPPPPGTAAHAPGGAMPADASNATAGAGCLPADQSCFALPTGIPFSSRRDAAALACCTTTSYVVVLGISFGSLLAILLILCAIRWYLVHRSASREAAAAAAADETAPGMDKKRSAGLDVDAIAALPEFVYQKEEEDERECAVCLGAMTKGEAARRLPRCMHVFHRGCVDVWLREHSTCPVCRAEVVVRPADDGCAEKESEGSVSRASTLTARPAQERPVDDGERDLEAQQECVANMHGRN